MEKYSNWINQNVAPEDTPGECAYWSKVMLQNFPELLHIGGEVFHQFAKSGEYHEYLMTKDGKIIDPTRHQFDHIFGDNWSYGKTREVLN